MSQGNQFIKGTFILTIAGVVVKILGAVYRIPLYNILGAEGLGLFQAAYPIYAMMLSISVAGVPVAVSKLVAEKLAYKNYLGAHQVFRVSLLLMTATGLLVTGGLLLGARYYVENFLMVPDVYYPLVAMTPAVMFFSVKSAFRGYFQGQQQMIPTALSQIVEQLVRVVTIFGLATLLVRQSLVMGAAGAAFGTVTGAMVALALLIIIYQRQKPEFLKLSHGGTNSLRPVKNVVKEIFILALPITISSIVLPLVNTVDSTLILPRLQAGGFDKATSLELLGNLTGGAMPLISIPTIITVAMAASLIPAIAEANAANNRRMVLALSNLATRLGLLIGLPASLGLFMLAEPISIMLFNDIDVARPLTLAAFIVVFLTLQQTTAPVLQGLGKTFIPVRNTFIGLGFKVFLNYSLTSIPTVNILGPVIGTIVYFAVSSGLNYLAIIKTIGWKPGTLQSFLKPVFNTLVMGLFIYLTHPLARTVFGAVIDSPRTLASATTVVVILIGVSTYGLATLLTGTIRARELELIPKVGTKIAKILTNLRLVRR